MDVCPDVWGQLALEASQVYLTDGTAARSPFAGTVMHMDLKILSVNRASADGGLACLLVLIINYLSKFLSILCALNIRGSKVSDAASS